MSLKKWSYIVSGKEKGSRLDHFLFAKLSLPAGVPGVSKALVRKWILEGKAEVNRRRLALPARVLKEAEAVDFYFNLAQDQTRSQTERAGTPFTLKDIPILFEDDSIFVVAKPSGLPTQPTLDPARQNLYDLLKLRAGPNGYVGLHHRLDRDTSGVMIFTNRKEANLGIADAFKNREAKKIYLAVIGKKAGSTGRTPWPSESWTVENFLKKDDRKKGMMRSVRSGGDAAKTTFRLLASNTQAALVACMPHTGRMHQIRVHLSELGYPIIGDEMYGSSAEGRVLLHAATLTLPHPILRVNLLFSAPIPRDFLKCLHQLNLSEKSIPTSLQDLFARA